MGLAATKVSSKKRGSMKHASVRKRTQPALSKEYQTVFETTGKAMVIIEEDATISLVNAEFEKLSGFTKKEIEGKKSWTEFVARDDRKRVKEYHLLRRTDPMLAPRSFEFRFLDRQEKVKNIILTIGQIPRTNKSMASLLDITDRRQAEKTVQDKNSLEDLVENQTSELMKTNEALRAEIADLKHTVKQLQEEKELHQSLVENVDFCINLIDAEYTVVMANAEQNKRFNKPLSKIIGKKCYQEFEKRDAVCPHCPGVQTMATGQPAEAETEAIRDDGSRFYARIQTYPVLGQDGTVTGFTEVVEDITERKRIEDDLQETEERFHTVVETMKVGLNALDAKGVHTYVNEHLSEMLGYSAHEIMGHPVIGFLDEENRNILKKQLSRLRKGEHETFEITWTRKDGRKASTILAPTPILDAEGRYKGMYGFITDITERKRAEALLQQEKETFYTILQHALYGVALMEADGKHVYVNPEFTAITGYTLEDIPTGQDWMNKAYPDRAYRQKVTEFWRKDSKLRGTKRVVSINCKNGETKEIETSRTQLDNGLSVVMLSNITERKRAEEELQKSQQELQTIMDASPVPISWADKQGNLTYINRKHHELFGYKLEDIPTIAEWRRQAYQDSAQRKKLGSWENGIKKAKKDGRSLPPQEMTITCKDGSIRHVMLMRTLVSDRMLAIYSDITDRKQTEGELQSAYTDLKVSEERYRTLVENVDFGINLIDADHKVIMTNAALGRQFKKPVSEMIGKKCFQEFEKRDAVCPHCPGEQAMATGKSEEVDTEGMRDDGSRYHSRIQAFPTFGHDGTVTGFIEIVEDITERKRAEELLQQEKETFFTILQHSPYGVVLVDRDGKHLYVNPEFTAITGYTLDDIPTGKDWLHKAYPDKAYRQKVTVDWEKAKKSGVTNSVVSVVCKNGETKEIDFRPTMLDDGRAVAMLVDITDRKRAEKELRESEERFRNLFEQSNDAIVLHQYGKIIDVNHKTCEMLGYTKEQLLTMEIVGLHPEKERADVRKRTDVSQRSESILFETHWIRADGTMIDVEVSSKIVDYKKKIIQGIIREITKRKQMEDELRVSEERFKMLAEHAPLGISIMAPDRSFEYLNPRFTEIFGYTIEDIPDKDTWWEKAYPDATYRKKSIAIWKQDTAEAQNIGKEHERVFTVRCKDDQDKIINFKRIDLKDGKHYQIYEDITERKQMEEELRTSRMHLADAMDIARIAQWEADHQGKEFMLNDAFYALYGTTAEAEGGYRMPFEKFVRRFVHPDDEAVFNQVSKDIEKSTDQEQTLYHEHRFIHGNGEIRYVGVRNRVFRDASGNIIRTFGANQDITERKRAEEQLKRYAAELERSNEEVKNFAYIVSHDLRVPLVNLKGYTSELHSALEIIGPNVETALAHLNEDKRSAVAMALHEDVPEALEFITNSVSRMDSFINSVLQLSRLGRRELKPEPIDMHALVQTSLQPLSYQIQETGTTVTVGSLPRIVADRTAMEQVMGNILGNAVKYLDPERPGRIEVTAQTNNGEQIFRIRDNGRGIAEEDMQKVFAPFRRAGKQDTQGEGMGLAYVQTLIRRQDGRIWCESELGKGTTFTFAIAQHRAEGKDHVAH